MLFRRLLGPFVILLLPLAACADSGGQADSDPVDAVESAAETQGMPASDEECPHHWSWTDAQRDNIEAFTGGRDDIPAFNDCQRFVVGSRANPAYGDVFAIFIGEGAAAGDAGATGEMSAVALVAAYGAYEPLGMEAAGFYCLLTDGRSGPNAMIAPAGPDADCLDPDLSEGTPLFTVRRGGTPDSPVVNADVPGVARWGFDGVPGRGADPESDAWVQYAVLPCGDAVCYVGPTGPRGDGPGFAPKSPRAVLASISPGLPAGGAVRRVDGWNDIQFLADTELVDGETRLHPGLPVGVILPDELLGERSAKDFEAGWVRVAEVAISGSSGYEEKLNFASSAGGRYNVVDLCSYRGEAEGTGNCDGIPTSVTERCAGTDPQSPGELRWRRRHVNAETGEPRYFCARFESRTPEDAELDVPGIVRWKWLAEDEESWYRCPNGCCEGVG